MRWAALAAAGSLRPQFPEPLTDVIEPGYEFLYHTVWEGKTSLVGFLAKNELEATIPGCKNNPGACIWAANDGEVRIMTRKKKTPMTFTLEVQEHVAADEREQVMEQARLMRMDALRQVELVSTEAAKTGEKSRLRFKEIKYDSQEAELDGASLFEVLGVPEDISEKKLKSAWRRLSYDNHPDQGGDEETFDKLREAFEYLDKKELRDMYEKGGRLLPHRYQITKSAMEQQNNQILAMLDQQVPPDHPQRAMAEREVQMKMKTPQQIEDEIRSPQYLGSKPVDKDVPVPLEALVEGNEEFEFTYEIRKICLGCRKDSSQEKCALCGPCPYTVQVVQYQMWDGSIAQQEKTAASAELCAPHNVTTSFNLPAGGLEGMKLKTVQWGGDQTSGRFAPDVNLKLANAPHPSFSRFHEHLVTRIELSLEEAQKGFLKEFDTIVGHIVVKRDEVTEPGTIIRLAGRGLPGKDYRGKPKQGDLFVKLDVVLGREPAKEPLSDGEYRVTSGTGLTFQHAGTIDQLLKDAAKAELDEKAAKRAATLEAKALEREEKAAAKEKEAEAKAKAKAEAEDGDAEEEKPKKKKKSKKVEDAKKKSKKVEVEDEDL